LGSHLRLWPVAVLGLIADLWSKRLAFSHLSTDSPVILVPHVLSFRRVVNPGAMLGLGQGLGGLFVAASLLALLFVVYLFAHSGRSRRSLHVGLGLVLAGALGNLYDRTFHVADAVWGPPPPESFRLFKTDEILACGKLAGQDEGAWLIGDYPDGAAPRKVPKASDRTLKKTPVVRDFIKLDLRLGSVELWRWVFNVADSLLVVGVGLLLINCWSEHRRHAALKTSAACESAETSLPAENEQEIR
jgi:lipoprotein signal peptidase